MQTAGLRVATVGVTLMLAACAGGTPECASGDVKDKLKSIAEERLTLYVNNNAELAEILPGLAEAIRNRVSYKFTSIRTDEHDETVDTYQCSSMLSVSLDDGTNGKWEYPFHYSVNSVEESNSDFEVSYDQSELITLALAAGKIGQEILSESTRVHDVENLKQRLQEVRDGGAAWSEYEKDIVDEIRSKKGEAIPDVTPQQRQKSIEERLRLEDPMAGFVNPPEDVVAEIRRLRAQSVGEQGVEKSENVDEAMDDEPNGDVVVDN